MPEPTIGRTLIALGDLLQELAAARQVLAVRPARRDPEAIRLFQETNARLSPAIKEHRGFLAQHLLGLGGPGLAGAAKQPRPGTIGDRLLPLLPNVVADSNTGALQMFGNLRPTFYVRIFPRDLADMDRPYLHLALASGHGEPWALHWGFTCFRTERQQRGDVGGMVPAYSRGHLMSLQRIAAERPGELLEAFGVLQALRGPGETQAVPNMSAFDTTMPVQNQDDVRAWLIGERAHELGGEPGLVRRIDGGTPAARELEQTSDAELTESIGRFLQGCGHHFVVPTWERGHISAKPSAFISYRRSDDSAELAVALKTALAKRGHEAFLDVDGLKTGVDWPLELQGTIERSHAFVALAGPDYFGRMMKPTDQPDVVEMELATGLLANRPIHTYKLNGAKVPAANELPSSVRAVLNRNFTDIDLTSGEIAAAADRIADDIVSGLTPRGRG